LNSVALDSEKLMKYHGGLAGKRRSSGTGAIILTGNQGTVGVKAG